MGRIIGSYIFPHPPIIVPEVGKGGERDAAQTVDAVKKAAEAIGKDGPSTIILTSPHGPVFQDYIYISTDSRLKGDLGRFGSQVSLEFDNNIGLVNKIVEYAHSEGIYSGGLDNNISRKYKINRELDHGALVPLYFVNKACSNFKLVHISIAGLPFPDLYRFGMCISRAVEDSDEEVVILASGDLSHRLSQDAPYGYNEKGREFDSLLVNSLKNLNIESLLEIDEDFCENAGECGLRSFIMMFGALDGREITPEVYSYEGPFGVGYTVAKFEVGDKNPQREIYKRIEEKNKIGIKELRSGEDPYVSLARAALEAYVNEGRIIKAPEGLLKEMLEKKAGAFVSLKKHGQLRGCIGTIEPARKNIAEEIIHNAISSGTGDPRFSAVEPGELDKLVYSVDVLGKPEPIKSINELDVIKYGVIVKVGYKSGLLLPNLDGVDTPEKQVSISLQKAGIRPDEAFEMERFEVVRHK